MSDGSDRPIAEAQQRAAKHLEGLYGMVIAVGLGLAVVGTFPATNARLTVAWDHVPLLLALLILLVPFYHGALLHLDSKYRRDSTAAQDHTAGDLLIDFAGLFVEAVVIVALASSVGDVQSFTVGVAVLLLVDAIWATVAHTIEASSEALGSWVRINLYTLFVLGIVLLVGVFVDLSDALRRSGSRRRSARGRNQAGPTRQRSVPFKLAYARLRPRSLNTALAYSSFWLNLE